MRLFAFILLGFCAFAQAQTPTRVEVSCRGGDCPSGVGIVIPSGGGGLRCTGSLIARDLFITNSHCIAESLRHAGASCHGRMRAWFPAVHGYEQESVDCEEVVYASDLQGTDRATGHVVGILPDIAVLRLATHLDRQPFTLSRRGIGNEELFDIYRMEPATRTAGLIRATISHVSCRAMHRSAILSSFADDLDPVGTLMDCGFEHGNSGAPILDSRGRLRAIFHAVSAVDDGGSRVSGLGRITNLACARADGALPSSVPSGCRGRRPEDETRTEAERREAIAQEEATSIGDDEAERMISTNLSIWRRQIGVDAVQWRASAGRSGSWTPEVSCVQGSRLSDGSGQWDFEMPRWEFDFSRLDSWFRVMASLTESGRASATLRVRRESGSYRATVRIGGRMVFNDIVDECR